jgi:hypothetical protein
MPRERKLRLGCRGTRAKYRSSFPHRGFTGSKRYAISTRNVSAPRKLIKKPAHVRHVQHGRQQQQGLDDNVRGDAIWYDAVLLDDSTTSNRSGRSIALKYRAPRDLAWVTCPSRIMLPSAVCSPALRNIRADRYARVARPTPRARTSTLRPLRVSVGVRARRVAK